jgi:multisubunit Na+/H+ antiporter MnhB subunit
MSEPMPPTPEDVESSLAAARSANRRLTVTEMLILDTSVKILYPAILVLALYFLFAGHNRPGGGFVSGLMVGAALSLRFVSGGAEAVRSTFRLSSHMILGLGLVLSATVALMPVLLGGSILEHGELEYDLPIFHHVKLTSTFAFDLGVALVVIGLVLMAFAAFGDGRVGDPGDEDDGSDDRLPKVRIRR